MPEATPREKELSEELDRATRELASARTEIKLLREKIDGKRPPGRPSPCGS